MQKNPNAFLSFLFGYLLMTVASSSQNVSQIDVLSTNDGLSFRDVRSVVQDFVGLIWIGTNQGLNRYDGYNFKLYDSDQSNPFYIDKETIVSDLVVDRNGYLWYVANNYLYCLNPKTDQYYRYGSERGVCGDVKFLHKDVLGNIWIVSDDQWLVSENQPTQYLQILKGNQFETVAEVERGLQEFTTIRSDKKGNIVWATSNEGSLFVDQHGRLQKSIKLDSYDWYGDELYYVDSFFDSNNVHYVFPKSRGGVEIYNSDLKSFERIVDIPQVFDHAVEDEEGHLWFATVNSIYRYSQNHDLTNFTDFIKNMHDFFKINHLYLDKNQLLWISTDNGLIKINVEEPKFEQIYYSSKEGWGNTMRSIFETPKDGLIAFCEVEKSLVKIDSNLKTSKLNITKTKGDQPLNLKSARFFKVDERDNSIYTVNDRLIKISLDDYSYKEYKEYIPRLKPTTANPLERLPDGRLVFGFSLSKLTIFDPKNEEGELIFPNLDSDLDLHHIRFILAGQEKDILWIGTQYDGVIKINIHGKLLAHYHSQSELSLSKDWVLVLHEETPIKLWIGLYGGGLNLLDVNENRVYHYSTNDGLADNNVVGILPDDKNHLWLSTYNGISCLDKKNGTFRNFYEEDGLTHNEFNFTSYYKDREGYFYFGGMNGVNRFSPEILLQGKAFSEILLTSASIYDGKSSNTINLDLLNEPLDKLEISPYDHFFQVDWTIPNYFKSNKYQYYTKLEGLEDSWFYQGSSNSIRYNKLPADEYVLRIKGMDANGVSFTDELQIPIIVRQIFYKTWWFIGLVILFVSGIIYLFFNYRLNQLIAMERLRTRISSDLHDDVGSLLSGLAMQSELLQLKAAPEDKSKLQKIADLSRSAVAQMRDLVWSIDSRRERVSDLVDRMHELGEQLLLPKGISFKIDSQLVNPDKKLNAEIKKNLFLIFKEALTNIIRHSSANHVDVKLFNSSEGFQLMIKDNGNSSELSQSTGLGLSNMKLRAEQMKGQINFDQSGGFGISLDLPFSI